MLITPIGIGLREFEIAILVDSDNGITNSTGCHIFRHLTNTGSQWASKIHSQSFEQYQDNELI